MYNLMSCYFGGFFEGCTTAWFVLIFMFFIAAVTGKFLSEAIDFNKIGCIIGGILGYYFTFLFIGILKWALLGGIVGMLASGFLFVMFFGGSEE